MELPAFFSSVFLVAILVVNIWFLVQLLFPPTHPDKKKKIPSYSSGTTMEFIRAFRGTDILTYLYEQAKEMGYPKVFSARLPMAWRVMIVADHGIARDIFADPTSSKPSLIVSSADRITSGTNILSVPTNGKFWKDRRKGSARAFASAHIERMRQCCVEQTQEWIEETLKPSIEGGQAIDLCEEMIRITLRFLFSAAFEYEISNEQADKFAQQLKLTLAEYVMKQSPNPLRRLAFWLPEIRQADEAAKFLQDLALKVIQAHRDNPSASKDTLIGQIINNPCYKDDKDRAADITIYLFAGHDTTGFTLAWTMLYLAKNPEEMKKLRMELLGCSSPNEWSSCTRLQNVIRESFRIMPVGALGSVRTVGRDFEYKDVFIPKGTALFLSQFLIHRNPDVFEKPDEFIPDRWNNATPKQSNSVMPFAFGARNCIGQSLAIAELNYVIASLVLDYHWEVVQEGKPECFASLRPAGAKLRPVSLSSMH